METNKIWVLPEKCFEKRVGCTWRRGNQFTVYPRSQNVKDAGSETSDNKIMKIRQDVPLFTPILRKLVNESNGTFLAVQKAAESPDNQMELLKLSRQYRSIARVCIDNMQEALTAESNEYEINNLKSHITIFYTIECIWHLCEIMFISSIPRDVVLPHLLEWVRFHFPCHEMEATDMLEACERGSESNPQYWDVVTGMIVQGRVDVARALLKLHSCSDKEEFKLVDNALRTMPIYSVLGTTSTGEFSISWKHWQAECRAKVSSGVLAGNPNLELILKLTTGDYKTFEIVRDRYESWFDVVGGWLLFTAPWARRPELAAAAAACAGMRRRSARVTPLDVMVRSVMDGDLHQVMHEVQQLSDGGWCAAHLADLLAAAGKLTLRDKHQRDVTAEVRASLVQEYGARLLEHRSLWAAGLSYLCAGAAGAGAGAARAEALAERLPPGCEARALRLIAEVTRHGLPRVATTIATTLSAAHLSRGRGGAALAWAVRARSAAAAARAADAVLRAHCATGALAAADVLLTVGPRMLLSERLVFLCKYCEFHRMYKSGEFPAAARLLASLIGSNITPDYFWETLLLDTLPLLESDQVLLSAEATYEIMAILALRAKALSPEKADLLRLALVRNLAKASLNDVEE